MNGSDLDTLLQSLGEARRTLKESQHLSDQMAIDTDKGRASVRATVAAFQAVARRAVDLLHAADEHPVSEDYLRLIRVVPGIFTEAEEVLHWWKGVEAGPRSLPPVLPALLRSLRLHAEQEMTQRELAARLGFTEGAVRHIESGRNRPPLDTVAAWAAACGYGAVLRFEPWFGNHRLQETDTMHRRILVDRIAELPLDGVLVLANIADAWGEMPDVLRRALAAQVGGYSSRPWEPPTR